MGGHVASLLLCALAALYIKKRNQFHIKVKKRPLTESTEPHSCGETRVIFLRLTFKMHMFGFAFFVQVPGIKRPDTHP